MLLVAIDAAGQTHYGHPQRCEDRPLSVAFEYVTAAAMYGVGLVNEPAMAAVGINNFLPVMLHVVALKITAALRQLF